MTAAAVAPIVAIINDDETYQDMWSIQVEEGGVTEPYVVHRPAGGPLPPWKNLQMKWRTMRSMQYLIIAWRKGTLLNSPVRKSWLPCTNAGGTALDWSRPSKKSTRTQQFGSIVEKVPCSALVSRFRQPGNHPGLF